MDTPRKQDRSILDALPQAPNAPVPQPGARNFLQLMARGEHHDLTRVNRIFHARKMPMPGSDQYQNETETVPPSSERAGARLLCDMMYIGNYP
ncbi:MAG: hypothetical protein OXC13_15215 [Caldilineaceae bacterium]|nr:hypothetical protein [Caldilineaceae bacterium]